MPLKRSPRIALLPSVVTPADWRLGDHVVIPTAVSDEEARDKFQLGWHEIKLYLRVTPDPRN